MSVVCHYLDFADSPVFGICACLRLARERRGRRFKNIERNTSNSFVSNLRKNVLSVCQVAMRTISAYCVHVQIYAWLLHGKGNPKPNRLLPGRD